MEVNGPLTGPSVSVLPAVSGPGACPTSGPCANQVENVTAIPGKTKCISAIYRKARERDTYMNPYSCTPPRSTSFGPASLPVVTALRQWTMEANISPQVELMTHSSGTSGSGIPGDRERGRERLTGIRALHSPYRTRMRTGTRTRAR